MLSRSLYCNNFNNKNLIFAIPYDVLASNKKIVSFKHEQFLIARCKQMLTNRSYDQIIQIELTTFFYPKMHDCNASGRKICKCLAETNKTKTTTK